MRKFLYSITLLLCSFQCVAQNFEQVDAALQFYPTTFFSAQELATRIEKDFENPLDQARAAYGWIIHNVAYEPKEYNAYRLQYRFLEERNQKMEASRDAIIRRTLSKNIAVCEGYALTLERLCNLMNIPAYVVRGDVKTQVSDINRPFEKTHMWLVVKIADTSLLMDPTWGAGRYETAFKKDPSYRFFNAQPSQFIKTHYPEVWEDAYLAQPLSKEAFIQKPLVIAKELSWDEVLPQLGQIKAKTLKKGVTFKVSSDVQHITYTINNGPEREVMLGKEGTFLSFTIVTKAKPGALIIYGDGKPMVGYKIV